MNARGRGVLLITDGGRLRSEDKLGPILQQVVSVSSCLKAVILREQVHGGEFSAASDQKLRDLTRIVKRYRHSDDVKAIVHGSPALGSYCGADGVHLNRFTAPLIQNLEAETLFKGYSCHSVDELVWASHHKFDYACLSPVFAPNSKEIAPEYLLGSTGFRRCILEFESRCPSSSMLIYALGGINSQNVSSLDLNGAAGVAVVSAILDRPKPEQELVALSDMLSG